MPKNKLKEYLKKYEFLLTGLTVLVFILFLTIKLMIPNIYKAREIYQNKQQLQQKLKSLEKKSNTLEAMDDKMLKDNFAKLNYVIPRNKDYSLLFTTLDLLQEKIGLSITRTDFELGNVSTRSALFKKNVNGENYKIPISLEVIGTYEQVQDFLTQLSDLSGRLITVDQIKLQLENPQIVKATITGNTFYNPFPKTIGGVDSPLPDFNQNLQTLFKKIQENQYPVDVIENTNEDVPVGKDDLFQ